MPQSPVGSAVRTAPRRHEEWERLHWCGTTLVLLGVHQRAVQQEASPASPSIEGQPAVAAHDDREVDNARCAALAAAYESERNQLLGGDRMTLKARLVELGDVYRARMKSISGCSFSIL
jgi:hypothetical protein